MGRAPTLIHVKAIKPATNERRNLLHGRRHHGPRHIAVSSFADVAGHRDGRMRLRAVYVVSPPRLAASFILDAASVAFSAPELCRSLAGRQHMVLAGSDLADEAADLPHIIEPLDHIVLLAATFHSSLVLGCGSRRWTTARDSRANIPRPVLGTPCFQKGWVGNSQKWSLR